MSTYIPFYAKKLKCYDGKKKKFKKKLFLMVLYFVKPQTDPYSPVHNTLKNRDCTSDRQTSDGKTRAAIVLKLFIIETKMGIH